MKCLVSKGFKYLVALFIILSCVSVRAMAKETNDTADQSNRITEKGNTSKDETFDTTDELMSNDPKRSISSQDSASDKGKNEASSTKDSVKTEYTFEDSKIKVKAVLKKADAVSDQAELKVKEIPENTTEYKKYESALNKKADAYSNVLLYDISFMLNGKEVEPADGSVKVSMEFKDKQLSDDLKVKSASDLKVIHFKDNDVNKQESLTPTTNVKSETTSFETKSFSAYAVIDSANATKVDFDYKSVDSGYGIIAHQYEQLTDSESNIYVDKINSLNAHFGSSSRFTNVGGDNFIGDIDSSLLKNTPNLQFHEPPSKLYLGSSIYNTNSTIEKHNDNSYYLHIDDKDATDINYKKTIEFSNIGRDAFRSASGMSTAQQVISNLSSKYAAISSHGNEIGGSEIQIDLTGLGSGTYVVTYNGNSLGEQGNKLNVKIKEDQHLIIYCPTSNNITLSNYTINGRPTKNASENNVSGILQSDNDSDKVYKEKEWEMKSVSFYMPKTTDVTFKETCGIFIAPKAYGHTEATSGGIVACNSMKIGNGEWHYRNNHLDSPADLVFNARKEFKDGLWPEDSKNYSYRVVLKDDNASASQEVELTHQNALKSFDKITFSENGTYYYELYEDQQNARPNITYDKSVYHIKVIVKSVSEYGKTTYYISNIYYVKNNSTDKVKENDPNWSEMSSGDSTSYEVSFENIYEKNGTSADFNIKKTVDNNKPGSELDKKFTFGLQEKTNNQWSTDVQTATNDSEGNVKFTSITYDKTGEYYYKVYEKNTPSTYKSSGPIYIKVVVTKEGNTLKADATYYSNENCTNKLDSPVINNVTKNTALKIKKVDKDNTSTALSGAKFKLYKATLSNSRLTKGDQFGKEITTDSNGLASFSNLEYGSTYLLVETQAPNGYKTNGPWAVQIDSNGKTTLTKVNAVESNSYGLSDKDAVSKELGYTIPFEISDKKTEYTLPSTGGSGTKTLYMIGTLLSILGVIYIVFKKGKGGLLRNKKNL